VTGVSAVPVIEWSGNGHGLGDAVEERLNRCRGKAADNRLVQPTAVVAGRKPVHAGQSQSGCVLPGRDERDVRIQRGEQLSAGSCRLSPERQLGRIAVRDQIPEKAR
jgi:hypothetical protein